uniref:Uncharacterized protein n=1 Tax=Aegilops tauschii subsp. strangulata TaxID=200361 RepID=A0A453DIQ1_AEGTS
MLFEQRIDYASYIAETVGLSYCSFIKISIYKLDFDTKRNKLCT